MAGFGAQVMPLRLPFLHLWAQPSIHSDKLNVEVEWQQKCQPPHPLNLKTQLEKLKHKSDNLITFILVCTTLVVCPSQTDLPSQLDGIC